MKPSLYMACLYLQTESKKAMSCLPMPTKKMEDHTVEGLLEDAIGSMQELIVSCQKIRDELNETPTE